MTAVTTNTNLDHAKNARTQLPVHQLRNPASKMVRFLLHYLEMQIPMVLGMIPWHLLVRQLRTVPDYAVAFQRGSDLSILGHGLFMTVPMVAWMIFRRHGRRHSLEMGAAMLAPGLAIIVLCWLGADAYWPWLVGVASPAGSLAMLVYMLYRRDHFTSKAGQSAHAH